MPPAAALIFDMDGLLIDTELLYLKATQTVVAPFGHTVRLSDYAEWIGRDVSYADFQAVFPCPYGEQELWQRLRDEFHRLCATELAVRPGVVEFLTGVAAEYPKAVASSTRRAVIDRHLAQVGLLDHFPIRVSAKDVPRGKPAPDVFLETARQLAVDPARCVVFEDSPHGVRGARDAGMRAVAVPTEHTGHLDFTHADRVVGCLTEISQAWLRDAG